MEDSKETGVTGGKERGEVGEREREVSVKMVRELEGVLAVRSEKREREREERRRKRRQRKTQESSPEKNQTTEDSRNLDTPVGRDKPLTHQRVRFEENGREEKHIHDPHTNLPTSTRDTGNEPAVRISAATTSTPPDDPQLPLNTADIKSSSSDTPDESRTPAVSYETDPCTSSDTPEESKPLQTTTDPDQSLPTIDALHEATVDPLHGAAVAGMPSQLALTVAAIAASRRRGKLEETFGSNSNTDTSDSEPD